MKTKQGILLLQIISVLVLVAGCVTYDENGRAVLGSGSSPRVKQPSAEQVKEMQRDTRIAELENQVRRLQAELDGINISLKNVNDYSSRATREMDARATDITALRRDVTAVREDQATLRTKLDTIPSTFSSMLDEQRKSIMASVAAQQQQQQRAAAASSGRSTRTQSSGQFYEHTVGSGQTLSEIAQVYEVKVNEIMSANNLKSHTIYVGQKLLIPKR